MAADCNSIVGNFQSRQSFVCLGGEWGLEIYCILKSDSRFREGFIILTSLYTSNWFSVRFLQPRNQETDINTILMIPGQVKEADPSKIRSVIRIIQANDGTTRSLSQIFDETFFL